MKKNLALILVAIVLLVAGGFYAYKTFYKKTTEEPVANQNENNNKPSPIKGRIVFGNEVRTFQPCGGKDEVTESEWIDGQSKAYQQIKSAYEKAMISTGPYAPLYAEVRGKEIEPPKDGFGKDYKKAISIDELVLYSATGSCKSDLIVLENIRPGDYIDIKKPLLLTGKARGNWYFEASFPIQVLDRHANVLASGFATAQGDWMTTEFVPFTSTLTFSKNSTPDQFGKIVLKKDNPSDMRELDDALEVLAYFGSK